MWFLPAGLAVKLVQEPEEQFGISSSRNLLALQMKQATRLMAATPRASITQIAYSLGFADLSALSRAFTRFYGESPRKPAHAFA